MKEVCANVFAPVLRGLDRLLPVSLLLGLIFPVAWTRALLHRLWKGSRGLVQRPLWLSPDQPFNPKFLDRLPLYLNRILEFIPDRLHQSKWQQRCRIVGLENLLAEQSANHAAILAFVHFGPYSLLRSWLRAKGLPVSMFAGGVVEGRSTLMRKKDRWALLPEISAAFYQNQLAAAVEHLKSGRLLAIAIDVSTGRQMQVVSPEGWSLPLATGAMRLARRHRLPLIACAIRNEGPWRFTIELSAPVSPDVWARGDEVVGADLLDKLLPALRRHPHQSEPSLAARFQPVTEASRQSQAA